VAKACHSERGTDERASPRFLLADRVTAAKPPHPEYGACGFMNICYNFLKLATSKRSTSMTAPSPASLSLLAGLNAGMASALDFNFRFTGEGYPVPPTVVTGLISGLADGTADQINATITITSQRPMPRQEAGQSSLGAITLLEADLMLQEA
jgi:hypothetical protein